MRRALVLVGFLVAACGSPKSGGPAWPKMAERTDDGGESIAPRPGAKAIASAVADDDDADDDDDIKVVATPAAEKSTAEKPATVGAPTVTAPEDTITIEEIVIEIDD